MLNLILLPLFFLLSLTHAAHHKVVFLSNCPTAVLQLPRIGNLGVGTHTFDQDVYGALAFAGPKCDLREPACSAVEFSLIQAGYSVAYNKLIAPHKFTGASSFKLTPSGASATCANAHCGVTQAMFTENDYSAKRFDPDPNVGIEIRISCP